MNTRSHFAVAALAFGAHSAYAQPAAAPAHGTVVPTVGFSVGSASIASERATLAQVGDRSWGVQLDAGVIVRRFFTFGIDIGGQFLDDKAQFTQNTTGGERTSTASVTYLSALTGVRTGAVGPLTLAVNVGASMSFANRSIDNCTNCQVDKLKIPGGGFVEPALLIAVRRFHVRLVDRMFVGGDGMQSVMSVGALIPLHKKKR